MTSGLAISPARPATVRLDLDPTKPGTHMWVAYKSDSTGTKLGIP